MLNKVTFLKVCLMMGVKEFCVDNTIIVIKFIGKVYNLYQ